MFCTSSCVVDSYSLPRAYTVPTYLPSFHTGSLLVTHYSLTWLCRSFKGDGGGASRDGRVSE